MAGQTSLLALCVAIASLVVAAPRPSINVPSDPEVGYSIPLPDYDPALCDKAPIVQRDPKLAPSRGSFQEALVLAGAALDGDFDGANPASNPFPGKCKAHIHGTPDPKGVARISLCTFDPNADPGYTVTNAQVAHALGNILNIDGVTDADAFLGGLSLLDGPQPMYALIDRMEMRPV